MPNGRKKIFGNQLTGDPHGKSYTFADQRLGYHALHFLDDLNGYVRINDGLYYTINGGTTWNKINLEGATPLNFHGSIFFVNKEIGFITGGHQIAKFNESSITYTYYYTFFSYGSAAYHDLHFVSADISAMPQAGPMVVENNR